MRMGLHYWQKVQVPYGEKRRVYLGVSGFEPNGRFVLVEVNNPTDVGLVVKVRLLDRGWNNGIDMLLG